MCVGAAVGTTLVGKVVGISVGAAVGTSEVGALVGIEVGSFDGAADGPAVGAFVFVQRFGRTPSFVAGLAVDGVTSPFLQIDFDCPPLP
jgi:hypothetical protein